MSEPAPAVAVIQTHGRFRGVARVVGRGMIALAAVGLVLTSLRAGLWYLDAAAFWLPDYLALAVAGAVCCVIGRARRWALAGVICAALAAAMIAPCYRPPANPAEPERKPNLRVLQANVYEYNNDASTLLRFVRETNPDVILLQEVNGAWEERLRSLEAAYPHKLLSPRYPKGSPDLAQYWRGDSDSPIELTETGLPATLTALRVNGRTLNLLNVHTAAPFSPTRAARYRRQMETLAKFVTQLKGSTVLAGDLNSAFWSPLYDQLIRETHLVNARQGRGILGTWPSFFVLLRTSIDHLLASPDIQVIQCKVGPGIGSDHRPLLTDLCIPPPAKE